MGLRDAPDKREAGPNYKHKQSYGKDLKESSQGIVLINWQINQRKL